MLAGCGGSEEPERFGIAAGGLIEFSEPGELARELDAYVELGAGWIRFDAKWSAVETKRGMHHALRAAGRLAL